MQLDGERGLDGREAQLGKIDIEITPIGLGCAQMAVTGTAAGVYPPAEAEAVVKSALAGGVNWFDTAEGYGGSEQTLTSALRRARRAGQGDGRDQVVADGALGQQHPATIGDRISALQGYPIGLYLVHQPWGFPFIESEMHEMAKLLHAHSIRAIGVSNFSARQMSRAAKALRAEDIHLAAN